MLPAKILDICRLCLVKEQVDVNIFENESSQLLQKIAACLPISIAANDGLPKKICVSCSDKVNMLYEFWNQTINAEKHLLAWLGEDSNNSCLHLDEKAEDDRKTAKNNDRPCEENHNDEVMCADNDADSVDARENDPCESDSDVSTISLNINEEEQENSVSTKHLLEMKNSARTIFKKLLWFNEKKQRYEVAEDTAPVTKDKTVVNQQREPSPRPCNEKVKSKLKANNQQTVECENGKRSIKGRKVKRISYNEDYATWEEKEFKCKHCDEVFDSAVMRTKHEKAKHAKRDVKYNCDKCEYSTYTKGCFTMHLKRHIKQYTLFCKECNMGFFNNTELTTHDIKLHAAQPFQCAVCNDVFTSKGNLYSHIKSHDPNNSYMCEICGRTYKKKNSYKRHLARSHLGLTAKAQCTVCERILSSKEHLRRHMLTHTDERNWVCSTCGKCFLSKTYLNEHSRIHLGIRPYKCEICEKSFTQRGSLTIHKRSHTGERPYRCEFCNKGFVMSTLLRYHLNKCNEAKIRAEMSSNSQNDSNVNTYSTISDIVSDSHAAGFSSTGTVISDKSAVHSDKSSNSVIFVLPSPTSTSACTTSVITQFTDASVASLHIPLPGAESVSATPVTMVHTSHSDSQPVSVIAASETNPISVVK